MSCNKDEFERQKSSLHVHVLLYGKDMTVRRLECWQNICNRQKTPITLSIDRYESRFFQMIACGAEKISSEYRSVKHVLIIQNSFCQKNPRSNDAPGLSFGCPSTTNNSLPLAVKDAVLEVLHARDRLKRQAETLTSPTARGGAISICIKTDVWLGLELQHRTLLSRTGENRLNRTNSLSDISDKMAVLAGFCASPIRGASAIEIIDILSDDDDFNQQFDDSTQVHISQMGKSKEQKLSSQMKKRDVRGVIKMKPFNAFFLSGLKGYKEVKAKYYRYEKGLETKVEARRLALQEGDKAKTQVSLACQNFLKKRNGSYKFAFETCYDRLLDDEKGKDLQKLCSPSENTCDNASVNHNNKIASRLQKLCAAMSAEAELARLRKKSGQTVSLGANDSISKPKRDVSSSLHESRISIARTETALSNHIGYAFFLFQNSQQYRSVTYDRIATIIRQYPIQVDLGCIDYEYGKSHTRTKKIETTGSSFSIENYISKPVRKCKNFSERPPLIKAGGSCFRRLIQAIIHIEGPSGTNFPLLSHDNKYKEDQKLLRSKELKAADTFSQIWGVGVTSAARFVTCGLLTIKDLRNDEEVLASMNSQQRIGLSRYDDLILKIPRREVEELRDYVGGVVNKLSLNQVSVAACGSYRRGCDSSGDIDIMLLPNKAEDAADNAALKVMFPLLNNLRKRGFLTDDLALPCAFGENDGFTPGSDALSYVSLFPLGKFVFSYNVDNLVSLSLQVLFLFI